MEPYKGNKTQQPILMATQPRCPHRATDDRSSSDTDFLPSVLTLWPERSPELARRLCAHCCCQLCDLDPACCPLPWLHGGQSGACEHKGNNSHNLLGNSLLQFAKHLHNICSAVWTDHSPASYSVTTPIVQRRLSDLLQATRRVGELGIQTQAF